MKPEFTLHAFMINITMISTSCVARAVSERVFMFTLKVKMSSDDSSFFHSSNNSSEVKIYDKIYCAKRTRQNSGRSLMHI